MRSFLCLLAVGTLTVLVAAGLNIANQGINDLTLSNQGYVIALHLEDEGVYIEAMGEKYPAARPYCSRPRRRLYNRGSMAQGLYARTLGTAAAAIYQG